MNIEQVWPEWQVDRLIGKGSYGAVYRCMKAGDKGKEYAAVKVISVPQDDFEADSVGSEGMTGEQSREYYKDITDNFINEIKILEALKDEKHIVNIQDSKVVEKEDRVGWQIFIRMELLTDFNTYASDKTFTPDDVRRLALDLCDALIVCGKKRIVHRDIKPENIFVDAEGNFKLGDFGVAKQLEKTYASMSTKGTYNYMAPEVVASKKYDSRADIYSLGMVMYKLLNNNRLPFLDPEKKLIRFSERQEAFERRIKGEKIPPLAGVDDDLNEIILKACEFRPDDRYRNVEEFRDALARERPSSKFVRLIKKHKVVSAIAFLLVLSIISGSCGYGFTVIRAKTMKYPEKSFVLGVDQQVVSLNGIGIVSDSSGIRVVFEGTDSQPFREEYLSDHQAECLAFDGNSLCFTYYEKSSCKMMMLYSIAEEVLKNEVLIYTSHDKLIPAFFDENGLYFFKQSNEGSEKSNDMYYYSNKENSFKELIHNCNFVMEDLSVELINGCNYLVCSEKNEGDYYGLNNKIYVLDLNNIVEAPTPLISSGRFLCADNNYLYFAAQNNSDVSVFRCNSVNPKIKEIIKTPFNVYRSIIERSSPTSVGNGNYKDFGVFLYNDSIRNLIPINQKTIVRNDKIFVYTTIYDIFTHRKHRFLVDNSEISIIPADVFSIGCVIRKNNKEFVIGIFDTTIDVVFIPAFLRSVSDGALDEEWVDCIATTPIDTNIIINSNGVYYAYKDYQIGEDKERIAFSMAKYYFM